MLMHTALAAITDRALLRNGSPQILRRAPTPRTDPGSFSLMALYARWVRLSQGKTKTRAANPRASMLPSTV